MMNCRRLFQTLWHALLCLGPFSAVAASAASDPFTIQELLSIPAVRDTAVRSDGAVAWVQQAGGTWNIHVAHAPAYVRRQVTRYSDDDGMQISLVGFVPGAPRLVFTRGRTAFNPANLPDPPETALLVLSLQDGSIARLDGGTDAALDSPLVAPDGTQVLTAKGGEVWSYSLSEPRAPRRLFTTRGRVGSLLFSPDGGRLAFVSDRSIYDRGKYSFIGVFDPQRRSVTYLSPGVGLDQSPVWSPDGKRVAFLRFGYEPKTWRFSDHREGAPFSVVVADATSSEGREIWSSEPGYGSRLNGFGASGYSGLGGEGNLLWLADDTLVFPCERTGWKLLYGVPAAGGHARLLTPGTFEIDGVTVSPDRTAIVYWSNSKGDPHRLDLYRLTLEEGLRPRLLGASAGEDMRYDAQFVTADRLLYRHAGALVPERLMLQAGAGAPIQLSTGPAPGDPLTEKGVRAEIVSFRSEDGMEIPAVLYRPKHIRGKGKHPAIVHAHGGSRDKVYPVWSSFFGYPKVLQYFVSRGYFVLSVNYRSGTGYGLDFREPRSYGGRGAGDVQDFIAAARFLESSVPDVDPRRLVIYGHSYGGHIVSNALARSDVFAAGIDSAGVGDWVVEMEKDFEEPLPFNIPQRLELEQLAYSSSAISRIDAWGNEPVLFLHGDHDSAAAMQQTIELYLALQRRGKTVDALILPGEEHSLQLGRNQARYIEKIAAFLAEHVH